MTAAGMPITESTVLPVLFMVVVLLATGLVLLARRMLPDRPAPAVTREPDWLRADRAIARLRAAGLDTDTLLGPWLAHLRRGDHRDHP
ncbi:hypothetical protein LO762_06275 [Actinocorallia sp. API 0066]|uniref:hypothetical protein n=1 Tax=Actinocorallia sp. API 0066 TaxID=2896846 RepID=UPI001E3DE13A|nr:hypothetical protein [Actinocorallia sp. API 0066]MCD0448801.1 hypothetical protein [Actinocorallia sp. API 0066]